MSQVNVSKEALTKVRMALSDYYTDLSGFSAKVGQLSADISESTMSEMKKIEQKIEGKINEIKQHESAIEQLVETINRTTHEKKSAEQEIETKKDLVAKKQGDGVLLAEQIEELEKKNAEAERQRDAEAALEPSTARQTIDAARTGYDRPPSKLAVFLSFLSILRDIAQAFRGKSPPPDDVGSFESRARTIQAVLDSIPAATQGALESIERNIRHSRSLAEELESRPATHQSLRQLQDIASEMKQLQNEISALNKRIAQLQQKIDETYIDKKKKEEERDAAKKLLGKMQDKQEGMKTALAKLNDDMNTLLTASKSFETQAGAKTKESMGGIDKCIAAIDAYFLT